MNDIYRLLPNRVRRNYSGGAGIDAFRGNEEMADTNQPEEWIASTTLARNPGLPLVKGEGLAQCVLGDRTVPLINLLKTAPAFFFGDTYASQKGIDPGFLFKILDSSMRLHVQAHPTREFAQRNMNSPYGKLECYYILKVREGVQPYIRLGFQHAPTRQEWKQIIETQDITAMDGVFENIPIHEGEVWYVPGGMPHAIGEGVMMLEIMEPSDLVVRCEFEREGIVVPPEARFMGRGLDFCLDIFDYTERSATEIKRQCRLEPKLLIDDETHRLYRLIGKSLTGSFQVLDLRQNIDVSDLLIDKYTAAIVLNGQVTVTTDRESENLKRADTFIIAASAGKIQVRGDDAEVVLVQSML